MTRVQQYPFIFSDKRKYRVKRHLLFWGFWFLFQAFIYAFAPFPSSWDYFSRLPSSILDSTLFLPSHMFLSYTLMYIVIPLFILKHKYIGAALSISTLVILTACMAAVISIYLLPPLRKLLLPDDFYFLIPTEIDQAKLFFHSLMAGLRGGMTVGGLAAAIKLMKNWYMQEQRSLRLEKENVESQLQLLKAQVHPHFLFNTLNNIYSKTQNTSPIASEMIFGLSDILRYILYECSKPLVPLVQELKMIDEYIKLERIRYGNKLDVHIALPQETDGYFIAPLMILPFIENCFKHGTSSVIDQPWINLTISIEENDMTMKLLNSKSPETVSTGAGGIGIENVKKRLDLIYEGNHQLTIREEVEVFIVILKLQLEKRNVQTTIGKLSLSSILN